MTSRRLTVEVSKPDEPKFLTEFKKAKGYKGEANILSKFKDDPVYTAENPKFEEELPVVILEGTELSAEEARSIIKQEEHVSGHKFSPKLKNNTKNASVSKSKSKPKLNTKVLSFNFDDD